MGLEREHELLYSTYGLLKSTVFHPDQGCFRVIAITLINIIRAIFIILSFLLIPFGDGSINSMADGVKSMTTWTQGFAKLLTLVLCEKQLAFLLKSADIFWETDTKVNDAIYKFGRIGLNTYKYSCYVTLVLFYIAPFFTHKVFFNCFVPNLPFAFEVLWFLQCFTLTSDAISVVATDTFFLACCISMIGQFRLVNIKLGSLNGNTQNITQELKACVEHHKFLLKFTQTLIDSYSAGLLCQYMITTFTMCMVIYEIAEFNENDNIIVSICYMGALILQLGSYCFPADEVIEEALKTSFALYSSEWYDFPVSTQKNIGHVIRRSQKATNFSAGGFISINKEAFTVIFKGAVSFYAAIKQVKDNNKEMEMM